MVCATLLPVLAIIVVALRLYSRFCITRAPGIDDLLVVLSLIFGIALSVLVMVGNQIYYNGYHVWVCVESLSHEVMLIARKDIPLSSAVPHRINVWTAQICYTLAISFVKISILLFYKRLSVSFTRKFLIAVWIGIVYNIIYCIGFIMVLLLLCRPISAYWLTFDRDYYLDGDWTCGREEVAEPLSAIFSVVGDAYSTIIPLVLVSKLTLPIRQKAALYGLFSLGFLVVIMGAVRSYYMYRVVNVDYDFTWTLWKIWVWGEWELWLAVYAASAPALKPLFKKYFDKLSTASGTGSRHKPVYLIRSDGKGGLGKVERIFVSNKRTSKAYQELSAGQRLPKTDDISDNQILKSVDYNVEPISAAERGLGTPDVWLAPLSPVRPRQR
jgi:hypothetical protein